MIPKRTGYFLTPAKVSAGTLLRLAEWIRQRSESSKSAGKTEQGGSECQIACPPAPNEGSGEIELCAVGHGDSAAGAALDADAVHSAAGNVAATDSDAGSTAGGPRRGSRSKFAERNRSRRNSPGKGGLR